MEEKSKQPENTSKNNELNESDIKESIKNPDPNSASFYLKSKNLDHTVLDPDHLNIETLGIKPSLLFKTAYELRENGFDYLQCQGGYDEGPGERLVSFYHLICMDEFIQSQIKGDKLILREVRLKVFLSRDSELKVPSLYKIYRGSDWQERETFDMYGIEFEDHPHPKRLLMPEDWKGWPLRKDYVQPDFYEMQDAY
tara:strand:- start:2230 stop:2820 length:591 start_codon:yes stop_codon:yes gene_type:complete